MGYHPLPEPTTAESLILADMGSDGAHVVYLRETRGQSFVEAKSVSARLPPECLSLFTEPVLDVDGLTDEEREWIASESDALAGEVAA